MLESHWKLGFDPFHPGAVPFVATPVHAEALARLRHVIESGERIASVWAKPGLGKTVLLDALRVQIRSPWCRVARCQGASDISTLCDELARSLGVPHSMVSGTPGRSWRLLADAIRLCRLQHISVVLAIDDCQTLSDPDELERLARLDAHPAARLTIIRAGRVPSWKPLRRTTWELKIRLDSLSRDETEGYLRQKLAAAGRRSLIFTPPAISRLHALAGGVPRGLDRLASLALVAGARDQLDRIGPDLVEQVAYECGASSNAADVLYETGQPIGKA